MDPRGNVAATIRIQADPFDAAAETAALTGGRAEIGAVVAFTGFCRDEGGRLSALELEHYPGMAEAELARIAGEGGLRRRDARGQRRPVGGRDAGVGALDLERAIRKDDDDQDDDRGREIER